jgi:hypothetical protein
MFQSQGYSLTIQVHLAVDDDLRLHHLVVLEQSQSEVKVELQPSLLHEFYQLRQFLFRTGRVEEDKDVVQTLLTTAQLLNAVTQQLDTVHSFLVGYIHESRHEFDGYKVADGFGEQCNGLFCFVPEEDVGVFVYDIDDFGVLHVLEVLQRLLVGLFAQIVHHDHLEVVLAVRVGDQVLDASVRLHHQIDQLLVLHVQIAGQQLLQLALLLLQFGCVPAAFLLQSVQPVYHQLDEPGDQQTTLALFTRCQFVQPLFQVEF